MPSLPAPGPFHAALPTLEAPHLRLRHPRASDRAAVLALFGDAEAMRYWSHEPLQTDAAAADYLARIDRGFAERRLFQWAIADPETDLLIGTVTVWQWDRQNRRAEIGYIVHPDRWGQGLGREAVRRVLRFCFDEMDLHRVEADVDPANEGSVRLLRRLGFREEGRMRERWFTCGRWTDSLLFGLLRSDFGG